MKIYIKYMFSTSCKMVVKSELKELGMDYGAINLGAVEIKENLTAERLEQIKNALSKCGMELMDDKKAILIENIKNIIIEMVNHIDDHPRINFSDFLSTKLNLNYTYLASLFSETAGITIEHYIIAIKIERVKELLLYDELNLTQISNKLHYSSVAHLSRQFKNVTGLTPTFFKQVKNKRQGMSGKT